MGVLDGLLGQVLGGAMNPGAGDDPRARTPGMPGGMGGLEQILGGGGGAGAGAGGMMALLPILLQVLSRNGGLGGLLSKFQQAGYREQADSWVSTGSNRPIDGGILSQVLGDAQMDEIAQKLGVPRREAADQVASALPDVVDHMTPQGSVPADSDDLVNRALEILQRGGR
jgi:uncharacterized protein YidB (DUF937 family)